MGVEIQSAVNLPIHFWTFYTYVDSTFVFKFFYSAELISPCHFSTVTSCLLVLMAPDLPTGGTLEKAKVVNLKCQPFPS